MLRFFNFQVNLSTDQGRIKEIEVTARMTGKPEVIRLKRKLVLRFYERLAGDSRRDQGLRSLRRSVFTLPAGTRTMSSAAVSAMATPRVPEV
jgi:hypothetical protein